MGEESELITGIPLVLSCSPLLEPIYIYIVWVKNPLELITGIFGSRFPLLVHHSVLLFFSEHSTCPSTGHVNVDRPSSCSRRRLRYRFAASFLVANLVTTSKALVTRSDALVTNSEPCY